MSEFVDDVVRKNFYSWMEDSVWFLAYYCHPHANHSLHHLMWFHFFFYVFSSWHSMHDGSKNCMGGFSMLHVQGWVLKRVRPGLNVQAEGWGRRGFNNQMSRNQMQGINLFPVSCSRKEISESVFWMVRVDVGHPESQSNKWAWMPTQKTLYSFINSILCECTIWYIILCILIFKLFYNIYII